MKVCSIDGCEKPLHGRGWCNTHYRRWRKWGNPHETKWIPQPRPEACDVEACGSAVYARRWCFNHYMRWHRRGGDPQQACDQRGERSPGWRGDEVTYFGMHQRVRRLRGKASDCICRCGAPATDWAYDHSDLNEKTQLIRGLSMPYSTDPNRYVPMCKSCHTALDREHANERKST